MKQFNLRPMANVLVSSSHGTMIVNRNDFHTAGGHTFGVGYDILQTGCFAHLEVDTALQLLMTRRQNYGDGVVALDCGANIGVHTIEWAQLMHGWGNVIAIEAQERVFYSLAGNIAINNCFNARAIWGAVGANSGTLGVPTPDYFKPSSYGSLELRKKDSTEFIGQDIDYSSEHLQEVRMLTIDALKLERLDFLKIDIEGMEMEALAGCAETIARTKPQILIENLKTNAEELNSFLLQHQYRLYPLGMNTLATHESDPVTVNVVPAA
ncbi:MAG: FkbM family methyltransferase [Burkholderiales bacterium]|nr:FkbM family methyltransferase [Burkholderiales bacterium]